MTGLDFEWLRQPDLIRDKHLTMMAKYSYNSDNLENRLFILGVLGIGRSGDTSLLIPRNGTEELLSRDDD